MRGRPGISRGRSTELTHCSISGTMYTAVYLLAWLPLLQALPFPVPSRDLPTSSGDARRAAQLALTYHNYLTGSPHQLLEEDEVRRATLTVVPEIGHKYYVEFTAHISETLENIGLCTATVFFQEDKPRPAINVNCSSTKIQKQASDDDYSFYKVMKSQTIPITGENIPDRFGYIEPQLEPVWRLAKLGSSYVIWDKTSEGHEYNMQQIKSVKQVLRKDNLIGFDYEVYLHERPSEEMVSCSVHVVWIPGKPPKVDYSCTEDSENGSGNKSEDGSAYLGNFK